MHAMAGKVPLQPLHAPAVGGESVLAEQIFAKSKNIGRIEQGLVFGCDEVQRGGSAQAFIDGDLVEIALLISLVRQAGPRRLLPSKFRILVEVALHQRVIGQVLPVAAPKRHGCAQDFLAHRKQYITGRHAAEHGTGGKIRRDCGLIPLQRRWPIDANTPLLENTHEEVQLFIRFLHCLQRARAPHASHVAVLGNLGLGGGFRRRNTRVVGSAYDDVPQRIEIIPG
jgi:hypothetical protein